MGRQHGGTYRIEATASQFNMTKWATRNGETATNRRRHMSVTEHTDENRCAVDVAEAKPWLFKPGQSGNPAGRPVGARNRLAETFLEDLYRDWREHGAQSIETVRENDPSTYLKIVAGLIPREMQLNIGLGEQLGAMLERMQETPHEVVNGEAVEVVDIMPNGDAVVTSNDGQR